MAELGRSCAQNWQMINLGVIDPIWGQERAKRPFCTAFYQLTCGFLEFSLLAVLMDGLWIGSPKTNTRLETQTQVLCLRTNVLFKDKSGLILHSNTCV